MRRRGSFLREASTWSRKPAVSGWSRKSATGCRRDAIRERAPPAAGDAQQGAGAQQPNVERQARHRPPAHLAVAAAALAVGGIEDERHVLLGDLRCELAGQAREDAAPAPVRVGRGVHRAHRLHLAAGPMPAPAQEGTDADDAATRGGQQDRRCAERVAPRASSARNRRCAARSPRRGRCAAAPPPRPRRRRGLGGSSSHFAPAPLSTLS